MRNLINKCYITILNNLPLIEKERFTHFFYIINLIPSALFN